MIAHEEIFSPAFKEQPFWWEEGPPTALAPIDLPRKVDAAVVGSGITGLNAAIVLARAGRSVLVLESGDACEGASSRNAGYVGRTLKHSFSGIARKHGQERAVAVYQGLQEAFDAVAEIVRSEQIRCDFKTCGRLILAPSRWHYDELAAEFAERKAVLGQDYEMVPAHALGREISSDAYVGGVVIPDLAALHPGLYVKGLLGVAARSGAIIATRTPVTSVSANGTPEVFTVTTRRGSVQATNVLVATNGYTSTVSPWLLRRVIPFDAYMIATEPLPRAQAEALMPGDRTYLDANHNINFVRRFHDGRILFGGRTGSRTPSLRAMAARLHGELMKVIPGARGVRLSHAWTGRCAGTFDLNPHIGIHEGVHYAIGYCFAGVPMGTYLGQKAARKILGGRDAKTAFDDIAFPTVPLYSGNPWFVPWAMAGYDWLDRRHARH